MEIRKFVAPEFLFGVGALDLAGRYARNLGASRVLVVTDPGVEAAGWAAGVTDSLDAEGLPYVVFSEVSPNPREAEVMAGAELYAQQRCDVIVVVGGGSPMDCAKGIGVVANNRESVLHFEGVDRIARPMPPLICVPTTGGTSADVSQFCIVTDTARRVKIAIISKAVVPDVSLIDPRTLTTMDPYLTACTGIDALVHAIEAYVSNASSPLTDLHALEAIRLIAAHLLPCLAAPEDLQHRTEVMRASLEAGLAFSNASLGAVHAMAHSLGGFLDLPHGECNAILLRHVMSFNFDECEDRYHRIGQALGLSLDGLTGRAAAREILGAVDRLRTAAGVNRTLGALGVHRTDVSELARNALRDACMVTNPRVPGQRDIECIYEEAS